MAPYSKQGRLLSLGHISSGTQYCDNRKRLRVFVAVSVATGLERNQNTCILSPHYGDAALSEDIMAGNY